MMSKLFEGSFTKQDNGDVPVASDEIKEE